MRAILFVVSACALLAGCHAAPREVGEQLDGRTFLLQASEGAEVLASAPVRLQFADHYLSINANCNHLGGPYKVQAQQLVMQGMEQTEMGCDPARHAQDDWLSRFFTSKPSLSLDGMKLIFQRDQTRLSFLDRVVADPDRALEGTIWEVGTYVDGETAMGLMGIESPRVTFGPDGTFQARATCLEGSGRYKVAGDHIELTSTRYVTAECKDGNDRTAADFVSSVLGDGPVTYKVVGRQLSLERGARELGASAAEARAQ